MIFQLPVKITIVAVEGMKVKVEKSQLCRNDKYFRTHIRGGNTWIPFSFYLRTGTVYHHCRPMVAASAVRILPEYERGVLFRLGRFAGTRGPGLFFIIPGVDKLIRVSLRTVVMDVPPQDVITHDNVTVKVSAVIYFRVMEPEKAIIEVENFLYATSQLSQTTLRSVLGQVDLDELLANREKINRELQEILDRQAGPWGVKVSNVEVKNIDLPQEMMRAIAKQAEAERERRAKVIHAEGEL
jgi:regulator of protease activity HflC (stomatin/prohibitin superfamily)